MKQTECEDPPWTTGRISVCKEMTKYIKKDVQANIVKNIYPNHIQRNNDDTYKRCTDGSKIKQGVAFAVHSENFSTSKRVSNCTSILTTQLYRFLDTIKYSINVAEENIFIATVSNSSIQAIRKLYSRYPMFKQGNQLLAIS